MNEGNVSGSLNIFNTLYLRRDAIEILSMLRRLL